MSTDKKFTKEELFKQDPEQFIHLSEIIIAVKDDPNSDKAPMVYVDSARSEFWLRGSKEILSNRIDQLIYRREMMSAKKQAEDKKIISDMNQIIKK